MQGYHEQEQSALRVHRSELTSRRCRNSGKRLEGWAMSDAVFVWLVLSVQAGITAGVWLAVRRAVLEMEQ